MNQKNIFILVVVLLILGTLATVIFRSDDNEIITGKYDEFAQCLASKNLTMYGTYWCSYCKKNKDLFEGSFKYVPYVECSENSQVCLEKEVEAYPTWIDENGKKYVGVQSLETLSQISGCQLPIE